MAPLSRTGGPLLTSRRHIDLLRTSSSCCRPGRPRV
ncbi:putative leader peptide [Streptomyces sp. NPDC005876]